MSASDFWGLIDKISAILGLLSFSSIIWYIQNMRAAKRRANAIKKGKNASPAILAVSVGIGSPIEVDVISYINNDVRLRKELGISKTPELPENMYFSITIPERIDFLNAHSTETALRDFDRKLDTVSSQLKELGINRLHLFYCGPSVLAAKIGAKFSNRCTVLAYHYTHDLPQKYTCIGPVE